MIFSRFKDTVSAILVIAVFTSCASQQKISKKITKAFEQDSIFQNAFVGVSVFNTTTNQYLYNFNGTKYFVPASNIKLPTLYAGLKYLGKNLPGLKYAEQNDTLFLQPTGDPTFLHGDVPSRRAYDFLAHRPEKLLVYCELPTPRSPSARDACKSNLAAVIAAFATNRGRQITLTMASADPESELAKAFRNQIILKSRESGRRLIERAIQSREIALQTQILFHRNLTQEIRILL